MGRFFVKFAGLNQLRSGCAFLHISSIQVMHAILRERVLSAQRWVIEHQRHKSEVVLAFLQKVSTYSIDLGTGCLH